MSVVIYWLAIRVYAIVIRIAALFNPKARLFVKGRKGLLDEIRYALIDEQRPRIWMHCASLGEFEQGRPVLEALRKKYPMHALVLTFFSPSGYEVRKDYDGVDYVFYLPLDSQGNAKRFLKVVDPSLCLFVKYELWYFFLVRIAQLNIPSILLSAIFRKTQPFFQWYGRLHRRMLHTFTHIFVQDKDSVQLLNRIGVEHVSIGGDTRFDRVAAIAEQATELPVANTFSKGSKILVAGSTWPDDEKILQEAMSKIPSDWKLIIAPHEVHEQHIQQLKKLFDNECALWSAFEEKYAEKRVLIVDQIGLLAGLYRYADVAWLGGGFNSSGIHNILEAAVYGMPVFHGPNFNKFKEARDLSGLGASVVIENAASLVQQLELWNKDSLSYDTACDHAKKYVAGNKGATGKLIDYLDAKKLLTTS